mgnify:FL=1
MNCNLSIHYNKFHGSKKELREKVNEELDYLDTHILSILNNLNNINLENYKITSERVEIEEKSKKPSSGNSGGSQETATGQGGKESSGKSEDNKSSPKIDTTKMETDAVLEANQNDVDWKVIKYEIEINHGA